jgi:hypothetical protein
MDERHRVPVASLNRDDFAIGADRAGKRDDTRRGRRNLRVAQRSNVDPAMLSAGVRITADNERPKNVARRGPCPCVCRRRHEEDRDCRGQNQTAHADLLVVCFANVNTIAEAAVVVNIAYIRA